MKRYEHPRPIYPYDDWRIIETEYVEENQQRNESIFSLGNGYIGMRGNFEEGFHGKAGRSVVGNYLNGFYDTEPIHYPEGAYGYAEHSQTMLNVSDAKRIEIEVDGERFSLHSGKLHSYERILDMQQGQLIRRLEWESPTGKRLSMVWRRMICLEHKHLAAIDLELKPLNFSGEITLISAVDGKVSNQASGDDPRVGGKSNEQRLRTVQLNGNEQRLWIAQKTTNSGFTLLCAVDHDVRGVNTKSFHLDVAEIDQSVSLKYTIQVQSGQTLNLSKYIVYFTTRDVPEQELLEQAEQKLDYAKSASYDSLAAEQVSFLKRFWHYTDVEIKGDPALQQGIRFNAYQLLQSVGRDGKTNIGAKGLTGEGYEGHYFWDTEMYILPFFIYTNPQIALKLLDFRYSTLHQARERARQMSQAGALYPWRTINGEETSAYYPAGTAQVHINADIAHGIKSYVKATGDMEFLLQKGAEMLFETARFWVDLGHFNPARGGKFCIDMVTGPDEYTALVNNNAYTNLMAQDHLQYAVESAVWMREHHPEQYRDLVARIGLKEQEIAAWRQAADQMFVPYDEQLGIIAQDDSFLSKQRWDFANTPAENYPLLLHYHPLVIYRYQVLKQADLVLALYLLGNKFTLEEKVRNYNYYEQLTTHDSSLSPCIHSIVSADIGHSEQAYNYFIRTSRMDLDDVNRNVKDGLHTAAMAGAWLSIVHGFGGVREVDGIMHITPKLPEQWQSLRFRLTVQGTLLDVTVTSKETTYVRIEGEPLDIVHNGQEMRLNDRITASN